MMMMIVTLALKRQFFLHFLQLVFLLHRHGSDMVIQKQDSFKDLGVFYSPLFSILHSPYSIGLGLLRDWYHLSSVVVMLPVVVNIAESGLVDL